MCCPRPSMGAMTDLAALAALQAENERLIKLLENHGIAWQSPQQTAL